MPLPPPGDLGLTDEQLLLRRTVREFARERVAPRAHEHRRRPELPGGELARSGRAGPARRDRADASTAAPGSA